MTTTDSSTARDSRTAVTGEWRTEIVCDDAAVASLALEWDDLYQRCSRATAFTSFSWLESWWRHYGQSGRLVLVLVRRAGRLVAAAALMRRRRFGLSVLTPLGTGVSDFTDILLDDSCAGEAAHHLACAIASERRWHVVDLPEVSEPAAAWHLVQAWPRRTWTVPGSICTELSARSINELIDGLPRETAHTRRKKQRKIQKAGLETRVVTGSSVAAALVDLLRLHKQQWDGRGMNPEHGRARFAAHLLRAVPALAERDRAVLVEYRLASEPVAVELLVGGHRMLCTYLYGFRPDLRQRIDVAQLLLGTDLDIAQRLGRPTLSLLRGNEPYKRRWRPRETRNHRVLLACSGRIPATLYATGVRDRRRLAEIVKSRLPLAKTAGQRIKLFSR